jgi:sn-glycerol 3-phosphate transport system substrate-binding protein
MKKHLILSVVLLAIAAVFSLCGRHAAQQHAAQKKDGVEIVFYYPTQAGGSLARDMEAITAGFNAANNSGITVIPVYSGNYKQTAQKALAGIAAGSGPQVVLSGMLDIVDYYEAGAVQNINSYIEAEGTAWRDDFISGFWDSFIFGDNGVYGLPFQHSVCVLYYNKDMLKAAGMETPPAGRAGMLQAAAALKKRRRDIVPLEFPADVWVLENLVLSTGGALVTAGRQPNFDSPEAAASLDFLSQLVAAGAMIQGWAAAAEDFAAESCAMMFNTTANLGFIAGAASFNWGIALMPSETTPALSYGGGGLIMIAGQPEAQASASWEFMKYLTSPDVSARWMAASGYFAVRKSAENLEPAQQYYAANPQSIQAAALLEYIRPQWNIAHYWDIYAVMQLALDDVLTGKKTGAAAALSGVQAGAESLLGLRSK